MLKQYLKDIHKVAQPGDATEVSFYDPLKKLFDAYAVSANLKKIQVTTLPKATEAGNPDFKVWDGKQHIVGYIEAKAPTVEDLTKVEGTAQLKRYLHTFPNVILTNFFEFRLYRNGELTDKVQIGRPYVLYKLGKVPPLEREDEFLALLEKFFSFALPKVHNAKSLAVELAKRTRFLRDEVITQELAEEEKKREGFIHGFYEAFKKHLISGLTQEDFADLYSQTITYGLFAACTRSENGFNRKLAYDNIPRTIGILRDVFKFISLGDLPRQMEWIIDDISEVLAVTDTKKILDEYFKEHKGSDPIVHFYETFLAEYDPKTREKRGVYYTPEPVVSYIVRSLNIILKAYFGKSEGFASEDVTVLDPAGGTLTFMAEAAKLAVEEFTSKFGEAKKKDFIKEHILKNFYAFELMMAPYAIGHMKMSFLLEELGYRLKDDERFKYYLTNTLEMEELEQTELPGMVSLSEESHEAGRVKKEQPILVIMGNPPYSVSSANKSDFIEKEMELYKEDVRDEKNIQPLSDDYLKFLRFAHWKIEKAGQGIIGMITNNSYLSGLIHRGMRNKLLQSFDEIYILNLHGDSRIGEKCPDGSKDENVFDIMQGVSIALYVKYINSRENIKIYYQDLWGRRQNKYAFLIDNEINSIGWKALHPIEPFYFFIKKDLKGQTRYDKFTGMTNIFMNCASGIKTHRDHFLIDFDEEKLKRRIEMFRNPAVPIDIIEQSFKLKNSSTWNITKARKQLIEDQNWRDYFTKMLYRPFDVRNIYYSPIMIDRPRLEVMRHILRDNLSICFMRQVSLGEKYTHFLISNHIVDNRTFLSSKGIIQQAPLYLYSSEKREKVIAKYKSHRFTFGRAMLFEPQEEYRAKKPNISPEVMEGLSTIYAKSPIPEQVFYYIYGVLYSNTYRTKYAEFLRIDFPRVPFTKDYKLFKKMAEYGEKLVDLHLLKSKALDRTIAKFQGKGDDKVTRLTFDDKEERLYINKTQYFEGVPKEVYEYQIGGYQVCNKWLKDRKDWRLSLDDTKHYCKVVTALQKTIELQKAIDEIYPAVEKDIIEFPK